MLIRAPPERCRLLRRRKQTWSARNGDSSQPYSRFSSRFRGPAPGLKTRPDGSCRRSGLSPSQDSIRAKLNSFATLGAGGERYPVATPRSSSSSTQWSMFARTSQSSAASPASSRSRKRSSPRGSYSSSPSTPKTHTAAPASPLTRSCDALGSSTRCSVVGIGLSAASRSRISGVRSFERWSTRISSSQKPNTFRTACSTNRSSSRTSEIPTIRTATSLRAALGAKHAVEAPKTEQPRDPPRHGVAPHETRPPQPEGKVAPVEPHRDVLGREEPRQQTLVRRRRDVREPRLRADDVHQVRTRAVRIHTAQPVDVLDEDVVPRLGRREPMVERMQPVGRDGRAEHRVHDVLVGEVERIGDRAAAEEGGRREVDPLLGVAQASEHLLHEVARQRKEAGVDVRVLVRLRSADKLLPRGEGTCREAADERTDLSPLDVLEQRRERLDGDEVGVQQDGRPGAACERREPSREKGRAQGGRGDDLDGLLEDRALLRREAGVEDDQGLVVADEPERVHERDRAGPVAGVRHREEGAPSAAGRRLGRPHLQTFTSDRANRTASASAKKAATSTSTSPPRVYLASFRHHLSRRRTSRPAA